MALLSAHPLLAECALRQNLIKSRFFRQLCAPGGVTHVGARQLSDLLRDGVVISKRPTRHLQCSPSIRDVLEQNRTRTVTAVCSN